ncbi:unnamed protein product [Acanthoscelides obtectus]|uniref:glutathione transferase n=1 Tax=Acanthoscelides obtectus TaxID=200917 RepID=A0A9P0P934_ACAOB|nr:unnamed protein product [Acanthoscelides obtectus]CAK1635203.1 Glutathione S-transferase [Acanthoscelides obtectus]
MAPAYKVSYFNITALGQPITFLFSYGGIEFEDIRIEKEQWPQHKSKMFIKFLQSCDSQIFFSTEMPFGQMPVAKQVKLLGKDDWEDLEIDAAVDIVNDLRQKLGGYEVDEKIKKARGEILSKETLPYYIEKLNAQAEKTSGHLACNRVSIPASVSGMPIC